MTCFVMTFARCGSLASMCLSGTGSLPCLPFVMVGTSTIDMAAARPLRTESPVGRICFVAANPGRRVRGDRWSAGCVSLPHNPASGSHRHVPANSVADVCGKCLLLQAVPSMGCTRRRNPFGGAHTNPFPVAGWETGGLLGLGHFGLKPGRSLAGTSARRRKSVFRSSHKWLCGKGTSSPTVTWVFIAALPSYGGV